MALLVYGSEHIIFAFGFTLVWGALGGFTLFAVCCVYPVTTLRHQAGFLSYSREIPGEAHVGHRRQHSPQAPVPSIWHAISYPYQRESWRQVTITHTTLSLGPCTSAMQTDPASRRNPGKCAVSLCSWLWAGVPGSTDLCRHTRPLHGSCSPAVHCLQHVTHLSQKQGDGVSQVSV